MKLIDQILRKPLHVAFGQALQGGGITSVDLVTTRDATTVTMTASDGSAAPIAAADASAAGVMTASDKTKLDGLSNATTQDFSTRLDVAPEAIDAGVSHLRTAGYATAGDGGGALYKRVGAAPSHALKVQSADTAWWELVPDAGGINVHQAGAVGDNVADDTQPIQDCIDFLGTAFVGNGRILLPRGTYKTTSTIRVEDNVILEGEGYGSLTIGRSTVISVASGVTGFIVRKGDAAGDNNYGDNSLFRNLEIVAAGKNTTTTTGTMSAASKTLTLAAAADFANGEIIMVRGAGEVQTLMNSAYLTAATTASSATVTLSNAAGAYNGMVLQVAGAGFPADTYVSSGGGTTTLTMSANATSTVAAGAITYQNDLCVQIMSGGGTTTLTVNEAADQAVSGAEVLHYDCGIYAHSRISMERCIVRDFQGAGLFFHAGGDVDDEFGRGTNANLWHVIDARLTACRNGLRLKGNDANAGRAFGADVGANTEYGLVDASLLGNYFFGCHVSGGFGYMTVFLNANANFNACYTEGGTLNSFAEKTMISGGLMAATSGNYAGGSVVVTDTDALYQSRTRFYPDWHDYGLTLGDQNAAGNGVMSIDAIGLGGTTIKFLRSTAGHGQEGLWGWMVDGTASKGGMYFSDGEADQGAGHAYFLNGFFVGRDQATLTQTNFRRVLGGTAAPTAGSWKRGDVVMNHAPAAGGWAGWICVTNGAPGIWKGYGLIEA